MRQYFGKITLGLVFLTGIFLLGCEETDVYNGERLDGIWLVYEENDYNGYSEYVCKVVSDENNLSSIKIINFQDSYGDPGTTDDRYTLNVTIAGSRMSIAPQTVDEITIYFSSGLIYSDESFKIDYSYSLPGEEGMKTYNATANFIREN